MIWVFGKAPEIGTLKSYLQITSDGIQLFFFYGHSLGPIHHFYKESSATFCNFLSTIHAHRRSVLYFYMTYVIVSHFPHVSMHVNLNPHTLCSKNGT